MDKRVVVFIRLMSLFYLALISCDGLAGVNGNDDFQNATIITDFNQIIKTNNYGATKHESYRE